MKQITNDELADLYDKYNGGRPARTLPMNKVFEWAKKQEDKFFVDEEGWLYLLDEEDK